MKGEQKKLATSYVKIAEVTEIISDILCIPEFESRNITEEDVRKAYDKILDLDRKVVSDNKGEWILDETDNSVICEKCGCFLYPNDISNGEPHFCPNCGADMRGDKSE